MERYPRFSLRLSPGDLKKVDWMSQIRCRSRGQVVREAIDFYFNNRFRVSQNHQRTEVGGETGASA